MTPEIVIDANVVIKRVVPEVLSDQAHALLNTCEQDGVILRAPAFFLAELDSILRQKIVVRKELTEEQVQACWEQLQAIPIVLMDLIPFRKRAWEIAIDLGQGHVYDSVYLAVAESRNCEFWTADERLVNAASDRYTFIRSLNEQPLP